MQVLWYDNSHDKLFLLRLEGSDGNIKKEKYTDGIFFFFFFFFSWAMVKTFSCLWKNDFFCCSNGVCECSTHIFSGEVSQEHLLFRYILGKLKVHCKLWTFLQRVVNLEGSERGTVHEQINVGPRFCSYINNRTPYQSFTFLNKERL